MSTEHTALDSAEIDEVDKMLLEHLLPTMIPTTNAIEGAEGIAGCSSHFIGIHSAVLPAVNVFALLRMNHTAFHHLLHQIYRYLGHCVVLHHRDVVIVFRKFAFRHKVCHKAIKRIGGISCDRIEDFVKVGQLIALKGVVPALLNEILHQIFLCQIQHMHCDIVRQLRVMMIHQPLKVLECLGYDIRNDDTTCG